MNDDVRSLSNIFTQFKHEENKLNYKSNKDLTNAAIAEANTPSDLEIAMFILFVKYCFYAIRNKTFEDMPEDELKCFSCLMDPIMAYAKRCDEN